jgi:hypothetical protein
LCACILTKQHNLAKVGFNLRKGELFFSEMREEGRKEETNGWPESEFADPV